MNKQIAIFGGRECIKEKDNCNQYCKEGAVKLKAAITPTTENNDDLEEVLAAEENRAQEPESNESLVKAKAIVGDTPPPPSDMTPPKTPPFSMTLANRFTAWT